MEPDLADFLARHDPQGVEDAAWLDGSLRLRVTAYLGAEPPPLAYVNSARAIVFQGDAVLVVRGVLGPDDLHIVPGGRREGGETLAEALCREVLEETGWTIANIAMLGFMHFHILARPPDYAYPHSGFFNVVHAADAVTHDPAALLAGDVEIGVGFRPLDEIEALRLKSGERLFLSAALARRRRDAPRSTTPCDR
jgi:8-oxo-dGTP pyrophosphatase MutT (NUDIX family)